MDFLKVHFWSFNNIRTWRVFAEQVTIALTPNCFVKVSLWLPYYITAQPHTMNYWIRGEPARNITKYSSLGHDDACKQLRDLARTLQEHSRIYHDKLANIFMQSIICMCVSCTEVVALAHFTHKVDYMI